MLTNGIQKLDEKFDTKVNKLSAEVVGMGDKFGKKFDEQAKINEAVRESLEEVKRREAETRSHLIGLMKSVEDIKSLSLKRKFSDDLHPLHSGVSV